MSKQLRRWAIGAAALALYVAHSKLKN